MADNDQRSGWLARAKTAAKNLLGLSDNELTSGMMQADGAYNYDAVSVSMLLGSGRRQARSRTDLYRKWHYMAGDPIISTALRAHVMMALGGHETSGDVVFIEAKPDAEKDKGRMKIVQELQADLLPIFNRVAHPIAFNAAAFGDSYARVYVKEGEGIQDLYTDEMVYPPLVQPYERGNQTMGFVISTGRKFFERMTIKQIVRMKMPRMLYTAQVRVVEKALQANIKEDNLEELPLLPALIGGSFLEAADEAYDNLTSALGGLVGQRILNSIDESMIGANLEGMTVEQRKEFMESLKRMLQASKDRAAKAVQEGKPVTERTYHIMPTFSEKQMTQITNFNGTSGAQSMSIEDVMFHAKLLAGALGIDLSMLGFADILSGGLGDGGFFRTSAQAAEKSRIIRTALTQFYDDIVDLHTFSKYGWVFDKGDRPYKINFYGSISALENEKQASRERAMNGSAMLVQTLSQLKELKLGKDVNKQLLERNMEVDEDLAQLIAVGIEKAPSDEEEGGGGDFGGGFGGRHG
jgi:hypothetical protein